MSSLDTVPVPAQQAQQDYTPWAQVQDWEKHLPMLQVWEVQGMTVQKQHSLLGEGNVFPQPSFPIIAPRDSWNRDVQSVEIRYSTKEEHV